MNIYLFSFTLKQLSALRGARYALHCLQLPYLCRFIPACIINSSISSPNVFLVMQRVVFSYDVMFYRSIPAQILWLNKPNECSIDILLGWHESQRPDNSTSLRSTCVIDLVRFAAINMVLTQKFLLRKISRFNQWERGTEGCDNIKQTAGWLYFELYPFSGECVWNRIYVASGKCYNICVCLAGYEVTWVALRIMDM